MIKEALALHVLNKFLDAKLWLMAISFTPVWAFVNKYIWSDWDFLLWLALLITLDFATGVFRSWMKKEAIVSNGFRMTVIKMIQYGSFLVVMHVLTNFTIKGEEIQVYSWMTVPAYTLLMGIEAKSILENLQEMNRKFHLKDFIDRIKELTKLKGNDRPD